MTTIKGVLEIDQNRGVIYFHSDKTGHSPLRICQLPRPIPNPSAYGTCLDINHMDGCSWKGEKDDKIPLWVPSTTRPPDCSSYAHCKMYIINNDGFITTGFWYPTKCQWMDSSHKVDITNQVLEWMPMPKASSK